MTKNPRNQRSMTQFTMTIHVNQPSSSQQQQQQKKKKKKQPTKTTFTVRIPKEMAKPATKTKIKSALKTTHNKDREKKSVTFSPDIETWYQ